MVTEEVLDALLFSVDSHIDSCVLDSSASFHTTQIHQNPLELCCWRFRQGLFGYGMVLNFVGIGDVRIKVHSDSIWKLKTVRLVLKLMKNLISVRQLDDEKHVNNFHGDKWRINIGAKVVASRYKTSSFYMTTNLRDIVAIAYASGDST